MTLGLKNFHLLQVSDSCVLYTDVKPPLQAFISGNDSICSNTGNSAEVIISFSGGEPPYTFVYAINGIPQPSLPPTTLNPYIINTSEAGVYTLFASNGWKVETLQVEQTFSWGKVANNHEGYVYYQDVLVARITMENNFQLEVLDNDLVYSTMLTGLTSGYYWPTRVPPSNFDYMLEFPDFGQLRVYFRGTTSLVIFCFIIFCFVCLKGRYFL